MQVDERATFTRHPGSTDACGAGSSTPARRQPLLVALLRREGAVGALAGAATRRMRRALRAARIWRAPGRSRPDARESYVSGACDAVDLERRERRWDQGESNAFSLADWT